MASAGLYASLHLAPDDTTQAPHRSVFFARRMPLCRPANSVKALKALRLHTHPFTHPFNGPFSRTTQASRYQKGKTNLDFTEARDSEWQWHQREHMQVCTSLQTDNHAKHPTTQFFTGRMPFLPPNQQRQSTEGLALRLHPAKIIHWLRRPLSTVRHQCVHVLNSRQL